MQDNTYQLPKHCFLGLLIALGLLFVLAPLAHQGEYGRLAINFSLFGVIVFAVSLVYHQRWVLITAIALGIPAVLRLGIYDVLWIEWVSLISSALFFAFVIVMMLRYLFTSKNIDLDIIYGAVCIYLLLGVVWEILYSLIEAFQPGSFSTTDEASLIYYSFVTLTTLGYGDIVPTSQIAKSLSTLEAATGQLYLTVLVARLVGMHIAQRK